MRPLPPMLLAALLILPHAHAFAQTASTSTVTLADCYRLADANYEPLNLAREEIRVAGWKFAESSRNLLPTLSVKAEQTDGEADRTLGTPRFTEQSYGLQMNYALFEGGRSWATRNQARSNYRIAKIKYDKARQEMLYGVREAYWNLARVSANAEEARKALEEIRKHQMTSQKLFSGGIIAERDLLAIQSQYNQAAYQAESAAADLENFSWKLADALGLKRPLPSFTAVDLTFTETTISLDECLALAETKNPDMVLQKESVAAARHGAASKRGYRLPKIDLNGFYGRSGGAFENEELKLTEDYQVGVTLTQFFLFNTVSGSGMRQRTSPKLGQSSRTEIQTLSASIGLLDGYKQVAEERDADFAYRQALFGMDKTRSEVQAQVRDAYFNYRKALAQVRNTKVELAIAEKELSISRINAGSDRSGVAAVVEAINKNAGARSALNEAKTFYLISIAALNKAVGIVDKFNVE